MLPTPLLINRFRGEEIEPKRLALDEDTRALAVELIDLFRYCLGRRRLDLDAELQAFEGEETDYRVKRGLAHLLASFATFEPQSPLDPPALRERVFERAAERAPGADTTALVLDRVAAELSEEGGREVGASEVRAGLYADLKENHVMTAFEAPTPEALVHRYNLAQVQGVLYRASEIRITARRNDPGEYKQLFRYLKLFGLMAYVEGDADTGFTLTIDGPASLFGASTRYGLGLAKFLPALLLVSRWSLDATLVPRRNAEPGAPERFTLDASCGLVSHYKRGQAFDSAVERAFAERWAKTGTPWRLEREVDLLPLPGSAMIPDFRLVHPDGREVLLEIVGYWRPEYLRRKFAQVRRASPANLLLAVSERLNLAGAGVDAPSLPVRVVWFKERLQPKAVLEALEGMAGEAGR